MNLTDLLMLISSVCLAAIEQTVWNLIKTGKHKINKVRMGNKI